MSAHLGDFHNYKTKNKSKLEHFCYKLEVKDSFCWNWLKSAELLSHLMNWCPSKHLFLFLFLFCYHCTFITSRSLASGQQWALNLCISAGSCSLVCIHLFRCPKTRHPASPRWLSRRAPSLPAGGGDWCTARIKATGMTHRLPAGTLWVQLMPPSGEWTILQQSLLELSIHKHTIYMQGFLHVARWMAGEPNRSGARHTS